MNRLYRSPVRPMPLGIWVSLTAHWNKQAEQLIPKFTRQSAASSIYGKPAKKSSSSHFTGIAAGLCACISARKSSVVLCKEHSNNSAQQATRAAAVRSNGYWSGFKSGSSTMLMRRVVALLMPHFTESCSLMRKDWTQSTWRAEDREAIVDVMRRFLRASTTLVRCFPLGELEQSAPGDCESQRSLDQA